MNRPAGVASGRNKNISKTYVLQTVLLELYRMVEGHVGIHLRLNTECTNFTNYEYNEYILLMSVKILHTKMRFR